MQIIRFNKIKLKISLFSMILFLLVTHCCKAQKTACENSVNDISKAYNDGQWNKCKNLAIAFVKIFPFEEVTLFSGRAKRGDIAYCLNYIPQVYYYLIKSCIRLNEPDMAKRYSSDAINNEVKINFDSTDTDIIEKLGKIPVRKYSFSPFLGIISGNLREYKLALDFGISSFLNFEISYNKRNFNHNSDEQYGLFGKTLKSVPNATPYYSFELSGNSRYIDMAYFTKLAIYRTRNDVNSLYFSIGCYLSVYLYSDIKRYQIIQHNATGNDTAAQFFHNTDTYRNVNSTWIQMDLKKIYKDWLSGGLFLSYGSKTKLPRNWELFAELRITLGNNQPYDHPLFRSFKPSANYFTINIGLTKNFIRNYLE